MTTGTSSSSPLRRGRIVLTTFGSLGDLHPYLAIATGLRARGHDVVIATSEGYRQKVTGLGIGFHPIRPDLPDMQGNPTLMARVMDLRRGSEVIIREIIMPALRESYQDLLAAADGAELLVGHPIAYAAPLVAERKQLRWASVMLAPFTFFSAYDPPVIPGAEILDRARFLGPLLFKPILGMARWWVRSWCQPWHQLRAEIGLPPAGNPIFEGGNSPHLVLALFSSLLGDRQPDWPAHTRITGFPFFDQDAGTEMPPDLARFLDAGSAPIVFTLGSSAVMDARQFYQHSAAVAQMLGRRAVLLVGKDPRNRPASLPEGVAAFEYAPFSALFPRAAAIVHQGGVGTTAQAMRAGRPMLVMPYAHDQPDNAHRVRRLGIAQVVPRYRYSPERAAETLRELLGTPAYSAKAAEVGRLIRAEDGIGATCAALEDLLSGRADSAAAGKT